MTLIPPNTTIPDPAQTEKKHTKQVINLFTKGKPKPTILLTSICSHFCNAFPACSLHLLSLVILWDPSLPSWIPIIAQLYGCPCSATHASGTANTAPASCLQNRGNGVAEHQTEQWRKRADRRLMLVAGFEFVLVSLRDEEQEGERHRTEQENREKCKIEKKKSLL